MNAPNTSWFASLPATAAPAAAREPWLATPAQTLLATQVMVRDSDDASRDVGRRISPEELELFVSCAPGEALLQQFQVLQPPFLALHDIGCSISRRLLAGVAAASQRRMQRLVVRRQGQGTPLATLQFVEWTGPGSQPLRLYTTEVDADTNARHEIAQTLLGFSRLGVVFVGDLPGHALETALKPLARAMAGTHWPNRQLLMLPLASATLLSSHAAQLASASAVSVRTTPKVSRPAEAWSFLSATWNRLREQAGPSGATLPQLAGVASAASTAAPPAAAAAPAPARAPEAAPARPAPVVAPSDATLHACLERAMKITGMLGCLILDTVAHRTLAFAGGGFEPDALRRQSEVLLDAAARGADALGLRVSAPDVALTLGAHHWVLRSLPARPQQVFVALLDQASANLTLARLQIQRLDEVFEPA